MHLVPTFVQSASAILNGFIRLRRALRASKVALSIATSAGALSVILHNPGIPRRRQFLECAEHTYTYVHHNVKIAK